MRFVCLIVLTEIILAGCGTGVGGSDLAGSGCAQFTNSVACQDGSSGGVGCYWAPLPGEGCIPITSCGQAQSQGSCTNAAHTCAWANGGCADSTPAIAVSQCSNIDVTNGPAGCLTSYQATIPGLPCVRSGQGCTAGSGGNCFARVSGNACRAAGSSCAWSGANSTCTDSSTQATAVPSCSNVSSAECLTSFQPTIPGAPCAYKKFGNAGYICVAVALDPVPPAINDICAVTTSRNICEGITTCTWARTGHLCNVNAPLFCTNISGKCCPAGSPSCTATDANCIATPDGQGGVTCTDRADAVCTPDSLSAPTKCCSGTDLSSCPATGSSPGCSLIAPVCYTTP